MFLPIVDSDFLGGVSAQVDEIEAEERKRKEAEEFRERCERMTGAVTAHSVTELLKTSDQIANLADLMDDQ